MGLTGWLEDWIRKTNSDHATQRRSCVYWPALQGYFPAAFLTQAGFVVVDPLPFPFSLPFANRLFRWNLGNVVPSPFTAAAAITYDDTYYVRPAFAHHLSLHVHELVHVAQYRHLGTKSFLRHYLRQVLRTGYRDAALERMAYDLQRRFELEPVPFDILAEVSRQLSAATTAARPKTLRESSWH
ncbi:MAG: hypothetical protein WCR32_08950 [Geobacter sp.]|jgi:hypothetical protein|nr:hypothetical protein [Desulfovibrio desulfuricans]